MRITSTRVIERFVYADAGVTFGCEEAEQRKREMR